MSKVELLERQIEQLSDEELAQLRDWFVESDWKAWDRQIERASRAGKLGKLAQKALDDFAAGHTKLL